MLTSFRNKNIVITGASSGIGASLAREYAKLEANLILLARRLERLEKIKNEFRNTKGLIECYKCDVTKDEDFISVLENVREKFCFIDVLVANAGFGVVGKIAELTIDDFKRQFETNVWGVIRTIKYFMPLLQKESRIAIIGSVNGYLGLSGNAPYAMSKFAIRALSDCLRYELKNKKISVIYIAPGFIESEIRKVDNNGKFHPEYHEIIPSFILMPSEKAAKKIMSAINKKKREAVITIHAKILVFLERHFSFFLSKLIEFFNISARSTLNL